MLRANDKIGPYTLVRQLGRGAFGVVWLAERRGALATTEVAIKLALDEEPDIPTIQQEAQLWAKVGRHPNIVPIIEADIYDGQVVIISEYVPDGALDGWLKRHGGKAPSIEAALNMMAGILTGLEHLHNKKIIHRDLKPANILLQDDIPRLADFGIARVLKSSAQTATAAGTPAFMSPEAFNGERSEQSDIWSIGVILYLLLTGRVPFAQNDLISLIGAIATRDYDPLPATIPQPLQAIIQRALQKDVKARYCSAGEMRKDIQDYLTRMAANITTDDIGNTPTLKNIEANTGANEPEPAIPTIKVKSRGHKPGESTRAIDADEEKQLTDTDKVKPKSKKSDTGEGRKRTTKKNTDNSETKGQDRDKTDKEQNAVTAARDARERLNREIIDNTNKFKGNYNEPIIIGAQDTNKEAKKDTKKDPVITPSNYDNKKGGDVPFQMKKDEPPVTPPINSAPTPESGPGAVAIVLIVLALIGYGYYNYYKEEEAKKKLRGPGDSKVFGTPSPTPTSNKVTDALPLGEYKPKYQPKVQDPNVGEYGGVNTSDDYVYEDFSMGVVMPQYTSTASAKYTEAARQNSVQGVVTLECVFRKDGRVTDIKVVSGLGYGLDEEAIKAVSQYKFKPGTKNNVPINIHTRVELYFRLN